MKQNNSRYVKQHIASVGHHPIIGSKITSECSHLRKKIPTYIPVKQTETKMVTTNLRRNDVIR